MKDIKMIVTDLDGTLLTADKRITPYTAEVLRKKQEEGVKLVFATGRPYRVVDFYFDVLNPDSAIVHNGAVVYNGGKAIMYEGISPEDTREIVSTSYELFHKPDINIEIEEVIYLNCDPLPEWSESKSVYSHDFSDLPQLPAEKIIFINADVNNIQRHADKFPQSVYLQVFEGTVAALISKKGTKLKSIKMIAEMYGIPMENIACFGDDLNDMEMLSAAGFGVAMENALPEAKQSAQYITLSNDNDGVAKWIEENT